MCDGAALNCIEAGLLPKAVELGNMAEVGGSAGKEKSGFGSISMTGAVVIGPAADNPMLLLCR